MAHIRSAAQHLASEENMMAAKDSKAANAKQGQSLLVQGSKRRLLGDIGNTIVTAPAVRGQTGKENGKDGNAGLVKPRSNATAKQDIKDTSDAALRSSMAPRTRSQTLAARQAGLSMTSLLQTRSEAAVTNRMSLSSQPPVSPLPDIDSQDRNNPLAAPEYANDIYSYYKRVEPKYRVSPDYMVSQTDINEKMRGILTDWLVEVHLKFKLMPETLFLTCNLIDRFLEAKPVTRKNLQLVGVTAMLIASKYEEIWAPEVRDFVYISDKAYTREQILAMEKLMLNTLHFNLTLPTSYSFLARYIKAAGCHYDKQITMLTSYMIELCLPEYSTLKYSASMLATASLYAAMTAVGKADAFPKALMRHSGYTKDAILSCAATLVQLVQKAPTNSLNAVYKKYSNTKFAEASKLPPPVQIIEEAAAKGL